MRNFLGLLITLTIIISVSLVQAGETKIKYPLIFLDTCNTMGGEVLESLCNRYSIKYDWAGSDQHIGPLARHLSLGTGFPGLNTNKSYLYALNQKFQMEHHIIL